MSTTTWRSELGDLIKTNRLLALLEVGYRINLMCLQFAGYQMDIPADDKIIFRLEFGAKYTYIVKKIPHRYGFVSTRKFAIEYKTGSIYAVSSSNRPDRRRRYGSLDTLEFWSWREDKPKLRAFCS